MAQVRALAEHDRSLDRTGALRNLEKAVAAAQRIIPGIERHAPALRPCPAFSIPDTGWIKSGRYWFLYVVERPRTIVGVYFESSNIPRRF